MIWNPFAAFFSFGKHDSIEWIWHTNDTQVLEFERKAVRVGIEIELAGNNFLEKMFHFYILFKNEFISGKLSFIFFLKKVFCVCGGGVSYIISSHF